MSNTPFDMIQTAFCNSRQRISKSSFLRQQVGNLDDWSLYFLGAHTIMKRAKYGNTGYEVSSLRINFI